MPDPACGPVHGPSVWNSLELAKVGATLATPLLIALVGLWFRQALNRIDRRHWFHQKLMEKRMAVFELMARSLYDIVSFFTLTEHWKTLSPPAIVTAGRTVRSVTQINRPLFSPAFIRDVDQLFQLCFQSRPAGDLLLKSSLDDRKHPEGFRWETAWDALFVAPQGVDAQRRIQESYAQLLEQFSYEVGVRESGEGVR